MRLVLSLFLLADTLAAQSSAIATQRESVRAMEASIALQRGSVARMNMANVSPARLPAGGFPPTSMCIALPETEIGALVREASAREDLKPQLLRSVIQRESGFVPCAVSSKGAMGLMQLMPETAAELGVQNPFDPKQNVSAGARYLKQLIERYGGKVALALAAYNAGSARVDEAGGVPAIAETTDYVREIMRSAAP